LLERMILANVWHTWEIQAVHTEALLENHIE
jgi:hypothetical protein